jgi:hypothetical protein
MDFKTFKQNRGQMSESLAKMREEKEAKTFTDDSYFPKVDKNGNALVVVRILPQKDMNKHPIQHRYSHKDEIGGKRINLLCPSTFGTKKDCELCQIAGEEWSLQKESGIEFPKVSAYRKKTSLVNVLVIKDKAQPEMEGQVKKMYLANTLVDKINNKLFPPKDDSGELIRKPEMIHDLWEGKNFNLEIFKNKSGFNDFSNSCFEAESTPVAKTEKEIEAIYNQIHDITPDQTKCPTNAELLDKWNTFHKIDHTTSLENKKEEVKKVAEERKELEKAVEQAEEKFSNTDVEKNSNSDEELPW